VDWSVRQAQFHSSVEEFEFTERIHSQKTTSLTACHLDVLSASRTYAAHWPHTAFREASDPARVGSSPTRKEAFPRPPRFISGRITPHKSACVMVRGHLPPQSDPRKCVAKPL
jgi:hypothetical protein